MSRTLTTPTGATMIRATLPAALEAALLPWEAPGELARLHADLVDEHRPQGPTERHLVEQLTLHIWRKQRVVAAERALHLAALHDRLNSFIGGVGGLHADGLTRRALVCEEHAEREGRISAEAVRSTSDTDARDLVEIEADETMTRRALRILEQGQGRGLRARPWQRSSQAHAGWWEDLLAEALEGDGDDQTKHAGSPRPPISSVSSRPRSHGWYEKQRQQIASRPPVRRQAFGESLDPHRAARLQAHDIRLDRQLERTLGMLLKLQDLRGGQGKPAAGRQTVVRYIFHRVLMIGFITGSAGSEIAPGSTMRSTSQGRWQCR